MYPKQIQSTQQLMFFFIEQLAKQYFIMKLERTNVVTSGRSSSS